MMADLPDRVKAPGALIERAKELDKHYIPARYPNFHPEGAPMDYYTESEARKALDGAESIIEFCGSKIPQDQLQ
jgi:HEPN domain-containing protein